MPAQSRVERWLERPEDPPVRRRAADDGHSLRVIPGGGREPPPRRQVKQPVGPQRKREARLVRPKALLLIPLIILLGAALSYMTTRPGVLSGLMPAFASRLAEQPPRQEVAHQATPGPTKGQQRVGDARSAQPQAASAPTAIRTPIPDQAGLAILIRNAVVALDQANTTGDYSVLHRFAAPGFQEANTPARLAEIFSDLRSRRLDLSLVTTVNPNLDQQPTIDERGMLRLIGFFPLTAGQANFDLTYQLVEGRWRLFGIGINPTGPVQAKALPTGMPELPDSATMLSLIRGSIIALNQANMTGNYAVLRELTAPGFQQQNSVDHLATVFAEMRAEQIDFAPVAVIEPRLVQAPAIDERGIVRLTGFFPSKPEQVNFDLTFQIVDGQWRLLGIGLNTSQEPPIASTVPSPAANGADTAGAALREAAPASTVTTAEATPPIPRLRPAL